MIRKIGIGAAAAAVALSALATATPVGAQAYTTKFTTSVTYMNVGTGPANVSLQFYNQANGTAINVARPQLAQNAGTSVFVGGITDVGAGFTGSAVMSADQPVVATMVQIPQGSTTVKNRPLSNGFSSGASKFLVATVLKNRFNFTTKFPVQNVDTEALNVQVQFFNADTPSATPTHTATVASLPAGSAQFFDAGTIAQLGGTFNGSALITAAKANGQPGNVIAAAMELSTNSTGASSFEGIDATAAGSKFYMPSAVCNYQNASSAYAVQNTGDLDATTPASVKVTYSNGRTETKTVAVGAKASFVGCDAGNPAGFLGSAVLEATGNTIVAVGKVTGGGLSTAFLGASQGASKLALPYVRWSETGYNATRGYQRVFIAIQNVSGADLPAGAVRVRYIDKNGAEVGVHNLPAIANNAKVNSSALEVGAKEFGFYPDGSFGGSAVIEGPSGSQLVAIARVKSKTGPNDRDEVGEDYNGIVVQ